ncbi:hypothetical protein ACFQZ8_32645, partial [Micromonospora azadirachtae]
MCTQRTEPISAPVRFPASFAPQQRDWGHTMRTFAVSALREPPFPARRHDTTDRLAGESTAWALSFGLIDSGHRMSRLRRADAAGLAGRAAPDGPVDEVRL